MSAYLRRIVIVNGPHAGEIAEISHNAEYWALPNEISEYDDATYDGVAYKLFRGVLDNAGNLRYVMALPGTPRHEITELLAEIEKEATP